MNSIYLERLKRLTIMDDDFGRLVFKDLNCSKEVLKILHIIDDDTPIIHHETQSDLRNLNQRSVIFDILIQTNDSSIDIELENKKGRSHPLRARLHSSIMDVHLSKTNQEFKDLLGNIVIFICNFDPFGYGLPIYTIQRKINEIDLNFEDKSKIIYVNGHYKGDDEIGRLINDLKCSDPNMMYNEVLKERVKYFKESEGGNLEMCQIWDEIRQEGKAEGRAEGKAEGKAEGLFEALVNLMKKMTISLEEAMELLCIPKEDYPLYQSMLDK